MSAVIRIPPCLALYPAAPTLEFSLTGEWLFVKYYADKSSPLYYGYIYSQSFTSSGSC